MTGRWLLQWLWFYVINRYIFGDCIWRRAFMQQFFLSSFALFLNDICVKCVHIFRPKFRVGRVTLGLHSSALLKFVVSVPYTCTVPHQRGTSTLLTRTIPMAAEPAWKCATVDHFPMWFRSCQSKPYCAIISAWTQTQTVSHWYATCRTQSRVQNVMKMYHGGLLYTRLLGTLVKVNHPGTVWLSMAQYGSLQKALEHGSIHFLVVGVVRGKLVS